MIGKIIGQLRQEQSISVDELAKRSGVAAEKINQIETGGVTPSIGVMIKISRALGMRLGTLLDGHESAGAVVTRAKDNIVAPSDVISGGNSANHNNMSFFSLAQGKKDRAMEPMIVNVDSATDVASVRSEHEGEEFLYVLSGVIDVLYGSQKYTLDVGDSIYYDSIVPHAITTPSPVGARVLAVIYTPF